MLQQDPTAYRSFGVFWWWLKSQLKARYGARTLPFLGGTDRRDLTILLQKIYKTDEDMFRAAMHHAREQVLGGGKYSGSSALPNGEAYFLSDPDIEAAGINPQ